MLLLLRTACAQRGSGSGWGPVVLLLLRTTWAQVAVGVVFFVFVHCSVRNKTDLHSAIFLTSQTATYLLPKARVSTRPSETACGLGPTKRRPSPKIL